MYLLGLYFLLSPGVPFLLSQDEVTMFMGVQASPLSHCGLCILPDLRYWWSWQFGTAYCGQSWQCYLFYLGTLVAIREVSHKKVFSLIEGKKWVSSIKDVRSLYFSFQVLEYLDRPKLSVKCFSADKYIWKVDLLLPLPHRILIIAECQREFLFSIYLIFIWASAAVFGFFPVVFVLFSSW